MNDYLEAAKIQGFIWDQRVYHFKKLKKVIEMGFDEADYLVLALRYKELYSKNDNSNDKDNPFDIDSYLITIDTDRIDAAYMNAYFNEYLKDLRQTDVDYEQLQETVDKLHKSFATLTQGEQKYANIFIHDVQRGIAEIDDSKSFRDNITEYQFRAKNEQIRQLYNALGVELKSWKISRIPVFQK